MSGCGLNPKAPQERIQADEQGHRANRKRQPNDCREEHGECCEVICREGEGFVFDEPEPFCEVRVTAVLQGDESHVTQSHGDRARNQ